MLAQLWQIQIPLTLSGAVDVLTFMNGDALDLSAFGLLAQSSDAQFSTTGTKSRRRRI